MSKKPGDWLRTWWNRLIGCRKRHKDPWWVPDDKGKTVYFCYACDQIIEWNELPEVSNE